MGTQFACHPNPLNQPSTKGGNDMKQDNNNAIVQTAKVGDTVMSINSLGAEGFYGGYIVGRVVEVKHYPIHEGATTYVFRDYRDREGNERTRGYRQITIPHHDMTEYEGGNFIVVEKA
jgi:hypothetical protein